MKTSYASEHRRMKPVLEKAKEYSIADNPSPEALFEAGNSGFQIWCTPDDHPAGWEEVKMIAGSFKKPCSFIASATWEWDDETITGILLSTDAFDLHDHCIKNKIPHRIDLWKNRPEDIEWAIKKIGWLFAQANIPVPTIHIEGM